MAPSPPHGKPELVMASDSEKGKKRQIRRRRQRARSDTILKKTRPQQQQERQRRQQVAPSHLSTLHSGNHETNETEREETKQLVVAFEGVEHGEIQDNDDDNDDDDNDKDDEDGDDDDKAKADDDGNANQIENEEIPRRRRRGRSDTVSKKNQPQRKRKRRQQAVASYFSTLHSGNHETNENEQEESRLVVEFEEMEHGEILDNDDDEAQEEEEEDDDDDDIDDDNDENDDSYGNANQNENEEIQHEISVHERHVVATAVMEEDNALDENEHAPTIPPQSHPLAVAVIMQNDDVCCVCCGILKCSTSTEQRRLWNLGLLLCLALVFFVVVAAVAVFVSQPSDTLATNPNKDSNIDTTSVPSVSPSAKTRLTFVPASTTLMPTLRLIIVTNVPTPRPSLSPLPPTVQPSLQRIQSSSLSPSRDDSRRKELILKVARMISGDRVNVPDGPAQRAYRFLLEFDQQFTTIDTDNDALQQRYVMLVLYYAWSFDVDFGAPSSVESECMWGDVSCDVENVVTTIDLSNLNRVGTLPPEVGFLPRLHVLRLHFNKLEGTLPPEWGQLRNLAVLNLKDNFFTGTIPESWSGLTSLKTLILDTNLLQGPLSSGLVANWTSLDSIYLRNNMLTAEIPDTLTRVVQIGLAHNFLSGAIHPSLWSNPKLKVLQLTGNGFTGTIPSTIPSTKLAKLELDNNSFFGKIPTQLGQLSNLTFMTLHENRLSGTIPTELGKLDFLEVLTLYENVLSGEVPTTICDKVNVTMVILATDCGAKNPRVFCSCCTQCF